MKTIFISALIVLSKSDSECQDFSPSNDPLLGCGNDASFFFNPEYPEETINIPCLCCTPGIDDNPPDECINSPDLIGSQSIICSENYDCCMCESITCNDCVTLTCNGDQGCLGIKPIFVNGSRSSGGSISCNGDVSCFGTVIEGEVITGLLCDGDLSCGNSTMLLNLNAKVPSYIPGLALPFNGDKSAINVELIANNVGSVFCGGDFSCAFSTFNLVCKSPSETVGCIVNTGGDQAALRTKWEIINASSIGCAGDNSCEGASWDIYIIKGGGILDINGDAAARDSDFRIQNVNELGCTGDEACFNSQFNISCVKSGCPVSCLGENSCKKAKWRIDEVSSISCNGVNACCDQKLFANCIDSGCPITCSNSCPRVMFKVDQSYGVSCDGEVLKDGKRLGSCENSTFILDNNVAGSIVCLGFRSCKNSKFYASENNPITNINSLECTGEKSCYNTMLNVECESENGCSVLCSGSKACSAEGNGFSVKNINYIICSGGAQGAASCGSREFTFNPLNNNFNILCDGTNACKSSEFNLDYMGLQMSGLKGITCSSASSCQDSTFNFMNDNLEDDFVINEVVCGASNACADIEYNINSLGNITINKFVCGGSNACANKIINANLPKNSISKVVINIECNAMESCLNSQVIITVGGLEITEEETIELIGNRIFVTAKCSDNAGCETGTLNGILYTNELVNFAFTSNKEVSNNKSSNQIVNQFGIVCLAIIAILIISVTVLAFKSRNKKQVKGLKVANLSSNNLQI